MCLFKFCTPLIRCNSQGAKIVRKMTDILGRHIVLNAKYRPVTEESSFNKLSFHKTSTCSWQRAL